MPDTNFLNPNDGGIAWDERGSGRVRILGTPAACHVSEDRIAIAISAGKDLPTGIELFERIVAGIPARASESAWSGVAFDVRARKLIALRDPTGRVPLAFVETGGRAAAGWPSHELALATGIHVLPHDRRVARFCAGLDDDDPRDFLDDTYRVRAGEHVTLSAAGRSNRFVWRAPDPRDAADENQAIEELDRRLQAAVEALPQSVTLALSGGVDSALLATYLGQAGRHVRAVHLTSSVLPGVDESEQARKVADALGIPFQTFEIADRDIVVEASAYGPQPFPVTSLDHMLREVAGDLLVTGIGSDQLFTSNARRTLRLLARTGDWAGIVREGEFSIEALSAVGRGILERSDIGRVASSIARKPAAPNELERREPWLKASAWVRHDESDSTPAMLQSWAWELVVRNAWDAGGPSFHPYLEPEVWSHAASLPDSLRFRDGQDKWIVRELLRRRRSDLAEIADRPKSQTFNAFAVHRLIEQATSMPEPDRLEDLGVIRPQTFSNRWAAFQRASQRADAHWDRFHSVALWRTFAAEIWLRGL